MERVLVREDGPANFGKVIVPYEEENNKSFIHNEEFGIGEIKKLLAMGSSRR